MTLKLEGIWCPMATPLKRGGGVSTDGVKVLVDFLIEGGIDGLLPLGTSGEFALLTEEEKRVLLNHVVDQTNGRVPVVAGISDPSTENVLRFSKDAKDAGVDGVIATPPYYYSTRGFQRVLTYRSWYTTFPSGRILLFRPRLFKNSQMKDSHRRTPSAWPESAR